jgi:hypothetical protein
MADVAAPVERSAFRPFVLVAAAGVGALLAGTVALWAWYGSTVFFEMVASGFATCF